MMKLAIAPLAAVSMGAAAQTTSPATQFDLLCDRTPAANPRGLLPPERIRVDLISNEWCVDECERMFSLTATPEELVLRDEKTSGDTPIEQKITVNRRSAQIRTYIHVGQLSPSTTLQECEVAPFTGPSATPLF